MFLLQEPVRINWFDTSAQLGMRHEDDQPVSFSPAVLIDLKESAEHDHFICVSIPLPPPSLRGDLMGPSRRMPRHRHSHTNTLMVFSAAA